MLAYSVVQRNLFNSSRLCQKSVEEVGTQLGSFEICTVIIRSCFQEDENQKFPLVLFPLKSFLQATLLISSHPKLSYYKVNWSFIGPGSTLQLRKVFLCLFGWLFLIHRIAYFQITKLLRVHCHFVSLTEEIHSIHLMEYIR